MKRYPLRKSQRTGIVKLIRSKWWPVELRNGPEAIAYFYKTLTDADQSRMVSKFAIESRHERTAWLALDLIVSDCLKDNRQPPQALAGWLIDVREGRLRRPKYAKHSNAIKELLLCSAVAELVEASHESNAYEGLGVLRATSHYGNMTDHTACKIVGEAFYLSYSRVKNIWDKGQDCILASSPVL